MTLSVQLELLQVLLQRVIKVDNYMFVEERLFRTRFCWMEMTIYSPFHSIGFFSVFETELIKSADIYTGGFDATYGGRISSIMDITYRDGNRKSFGGKVSLSPFLGKAVLEVKSLFKKKGEESQLWNLFDQREAQFIRRDIFGVIQKHQQW